MLAFFEENRELLLQHKPLIIIDKPDRKLLELPARGRFLTPKDNERIAKWQGLQTELQIVEYDLNADAAVAKLPAFIIQQLQQREQQAAHSL